MAGFKWPGAFTALANLLTGSTVTGATITGSTMTTSSLAGTNVTATGNLGFAATAGGAVTQQTDKSTGVTLDKMCGAITMNGAQLATTAAVGFTLTNNKIAANDMVLVCIKSGATAATYDVIVDAVAAGSCHITLRNYSGSNYSEAIVLSFMVIKGVIA